MKTPIIKLNNPSAFKEFNSLWYTLKNITFYKSNGYKYNLPKNKQILDLVKYSPNFTKNQKINAKKNFIKYVYNPNNYVKVTNLINTVISKFPEEEFFRTLNKHNKLWGFKLFDTYYINLTAYGTGGSYNYSNGTVTVLTDSTGKFNFNPTQTIAHEIIHIGIEENIVKKYNLTHIEKENLVDAYCLNVFNKLLPNYKVQNFKKTPLLNLTKQNFSNLPKYIKEYVNKHPR